VAVIEFINGKRKNNNPPITYKTLGSVRRLINYIFSLEKTTEALMGGIYCNPITAYEEFILTKAMYNKLPEAQVSKSNQLIHFVQGFSGKEASPELAKKIAEELLQHSLFEGFQIAYAVHIDTDDIHTHFVINTVNYTNGPRWHISSSDLQKIKDRSDEILRSYNLSVINKLELHNEAKRRNRHISHGEYRASMDGRSWKAETLYAGLAAKKIAKDKDEFIHIMNDAGYKIRWEESRKDITFTNSDGKKINSDKLGYPGRNYTPLTKDALERQFALNRQVVENKNKSVVIQQDILKDKMLKLTSDLTRNDTQYPFQNSDALKEMVSEGQAIKDKMKQNQKGKALDWERE
jgi:hypothetical protein